MSQSIHGRDRVGRRCLRACIRCRDMKVRCSGTVPCTRCQRKRETCLFGREDTRVTVSQSYLESLESRVQRAQAPQLPTQLPTPQTHPGLSQSFTVSPPPSTAQTRSSNKESDSFPAEFNRNPLVDSQDQYALDPHGKYWYVGPTSSWAFCRRVLAVIGNRMPMPEAPVDPWDLETLNLTWNPIGMNEQPDVDNLPAHDYALFLASSVKYYLGSLYEIINHDSFIQQMERFYEAPQQVASQSRLWYAQFLLVIAFGEAFTRISSPKSVAGINYASRAMALIPNVINIDRNTMVAVETFCLAAIYFQAVDLRLMAFQLIGQGLRLCVIEGWHRHMPPAQVGVDHSQRCNTIFWTAYILDREFGTLVGAPSSIRDEDITTKLPTEIDNFARSTALELQIRLARLTAKILGGVYGVDRNFSGTLVKDTQSVLQSIADISRDLTVYLETKLHGTDIRTSKIATRLILSYHHCVVLTTRPLVMCLLQRRLAHRGKDGPNSSINSLLQSCTYSAVNILRTLKALSDSNLIDSFLPFQLETAFSSAFLLCLIDAILPDFVPDKSWLVAAHEIFDIMIARGSPAARLRKREFQRLEHILVSYLRERLEEADRLLETEVMDGFSSWGLLGPDGFPMSPTEILVLAEELQVDDFIDHS
ncbi:hypothetical protein GGI43DRAFT_427621 [Trichoderma evansii]